VTRLLVKVRHYSDSACAFPELVLLAAVIHVATMHTGAHGLAAGIVVAFDWHKHEVHQTF
jgi:hypothetical protein